MPAGGVYRVRPARIPAIAASAMNSGVSKSGSPALRLMMSRPSAASFLASVLTAIVADGLSFWTFGLSCITPPGEIWLRSNMGSGKTRIKLDRSTTLAFAMGNAAIRVFFDFIDPLSFLLTRELEALGESSSSAISWRPFELRPPPTPLTTVDDPSLAERWSAARTIAEPRGVTFEPPRLVPWTRKAHELVVHAAESDVAGRVRRRIFDAYALEGRDIGRVDVLVELAVEAGLDRTETKAVLDVDRHEAEVASMRVAADAEDVADAPTILAGTRRLEGFHNRDMLGTLLGT